MDLSVETAYRRANDFVVRILNGAKHADLPVMCGFSCKFALMAIGRSKGGDMRDLRDTYQNQLVPMVVEETNRGERAYDI